jgi:hypothetical protein
MFPFLTTLLGALAVISFSYASNGFILLLAIVFLGLTVYNIFSMYLTSPLHVGLYIGMISTILITVFYFSYLALCIAVISSVLYYMHWNMMQSTELMNGGDGLFSLYE